MDENAPREVLRDGKLKASLWRNEGQAGPFYSVSFARTYKDGNGELRDTHSFAGSELLRVSELARKAYDRTQELKREHRPSEGHDKEREDRREAFEARRNGASAPSRRSDPQR